MRREALGTESIPNETSETIQHRYVPETAVGTGLESLGRTSFLDYPTVTVIYPVFHLLGDAEKVCLEDTKSIVLEYSGVPSCIVLRQIAESPVSSWNTHFKLRGLERKLDGSFQRISTAFKVLGRVFGKYLDSSEKRSARRTGGGVPRSLDPAETSTSSFSAEGVLDLDLESPRRSGPQVVYERRRQSARRTVMVMAGYIVPFSLGQAVYSPLSTRLDPTPADRPPM